MYAVDLRGHGDSAWAIGGLYSMPDFVLDVVALAGGPSPDGDLNKVRLYRDGEELQLSFETGTVSGLTLQEIGIHSGDQIVVGRRAITGSDVALILQIAQLGLTIAILATQ